MITCIASQTDISDMMIVFVGNHGLVDGGSTWIGGRSVWTNGTSYHKELMSS